MVASVLAFADIAGLWDQVADVLRTEGALVTRDGHIRTASDSRESSALIYAIALSREERVGLDRLTTANGDRAPDLTSFEALMVECASGEEVARLGRLIATRLPARSGSLTAPTKHGQPAPLIRSG
ncbi:hypothetical protein ACFQU3_19425 [Terrabacter sp. GCM10028922]|uniref:hypothetical protein n=1 Tax=Terrabacter sp. GCM10028922 TaxID=3273428 RepID=UPI003615363F